MVNLGELWTHKLYGVELGMFVREHAWISVRQRLVLAAY